MSNLRMIRVSLVLLILLASLMSSCYTEVNPHKVNAQTVNAHIIPYTESRLGKYGRYIDDEIGCNLTWSSSCMLFKVTGTTTVKLKLQANLKSGKQCTIAAYVDNGISSHTKELTGPYNDEEIEITLISGISTMQHTIRIYNYLQLNHSSLKRNEYIKIKAINLDWSGRLQSWPQNGTKKLLFLGDSWSGHINGMTRFLSDRRWDQWPVGYGGFNVFKMNTYYPYKAMGVQHNDPNQEYCAIQFGVNEYRKGVSTSTYKENVQAIMDKVAADHTGITFFLIQVPRNVYAGEQFDKYGVVLQELAEENENTYYISTEPIWYSLSWKKTGGEVRGHLTATCNRDVYAPFIDDAMWSLIQ